jgi:hypothetical protein
MRQTTHCGKMQFFENIAYGSVRPVLTTFHLVRYTAAYNTTIADIMSH